MEKVVRDGQVAVVYSPGFGSGWYTWNKECPEIVFDPNIVKYVEDEDDDALRAYLGLKYPDMFIGSNIDDLTVGWIPVGTAFRIDEYDGNESIVTKEQDDWFIA